MRQVLIVLLMLGSSLVWGFDHQHRQFEEVLQSVVQWNTEGTSTSVDYQQLKSEPAPLRAYLAEISAVGVQDFDAWTGDQQLAFLINAYNAFTLQLILDHYPVDSIRDIGSFWKSAWKIQFFTLLGKKMHLDHLEHSVIRDWERYGEPRIHFAVNCASIGCPALRAEPYVAAQLEQQLEDSTRRFLSDESRNRWRNERFEVSRIFDWYREDFERGWRGADELVEFLSLYPQALGLEDKGQARDASVRFLDYDWGLNDLDSRD